MKKNLFLLSGVLLMASCSTPIEKRMDQLMKEGKNIISVSLSNDASPQTYLFYSDVNGLYFEDVVTAQKIRVINFDTIYRAVITYQNFDENEISIFQGSELLDEAFNVDMKYYAFNNCMIETTIKDKQYIFLVNNPDKCYVFEDVRFVPATASKSKEDAIQFTIKNEDAIEVNLIENDMAYFWVDNKEEMSPNLFEYEINIEMQKDGRFLDNPVLGFLSFKNIGKFYRVEDYKDGSMVEELSAILNDEVQKYMIKTVKTRSVFFRDLVNMFTHNKSKAEKDYPKNSTMILHTKLDKIEPMDSKSHYLIEYQYLFQDILHICTNDEAFADLTYPCEVYLQGTFTGMYTSGGFITVTTRHYDIYDAKLLFVVE